MHTSNPERQRAEPFDGVVSVQTSKEDKTMTRLRACPILQTNQTLQPAFCGCQPMPHVLRYLQWLARVVQNRSHSGCPCNQQKALPSFPLVDQLEPPFDVLKPCKNWVSTAPPRRDAQARPSSQHCSPTGRAWGRSLDLFSWVTNRFQQLLLTGGGEPVKCLRTQPYQNPWISSHGNLIHPKISGLYRFLANCRQKCVSKRPTGAFANTLLLIGFMGGLFFVFGGLNPWLLWKTTGKPPIGGQSSP